MLEQASEGLRSKSRQSSNPTVIDTVQAAARVLPTFASLVDPNEGTALEFIPTIEINGSKCA